MYRWQTITLARIEHIRPNCETTDCQLAVAKQVLIDIGLQHFPEPEIRYRGVPGRGNLGLRWTCDDRNLSISICPEGKAGVWQTDDSHGGGSDPQDILPRSEVQSAVRWLLFGKRPPADMIERGDDEPLIRIRLTHPVPPHARGDVMDVPESVGRKYIKVGMAEAVEESERNAGTLPDPFRPTPRERQPEIETGKFASCGTAPPPADVRDINHEAYWQP